jgi:hypothetical protein
MQCVHCLVCVHTIEFMTNLIALRAGGDELLLGSGTDSLAGPWVSWAN